MRKIKSVAFNVADPYELKLVNHLHQYPNFSGYVKRLIQRDMEGSTKTHLIEEVKSNDSHLMELMI